MPALLIFKIKLAHRSIKKVILSNSILLGGAVLLIVIIILGQGGYYFSFFREHKPLRYYANPSYYIYSTVEYANGFFRKDTPQTEAIGLDAFIVPTDEHRKIIVLVIGEAARADHFSVNGYDKKTNPYLEKESIINFTNTWSCGTSTAHSVPCMFSIDRRSDFNKQKARTTENVLDILQRVGVNVIWLDNNSGSQGVADRISYQNYNTPEKNPVCDTECRDVGMLANLQEYIDFHPQGDIFIILHQMGNHGPAYYKRYPEAFEKFTPICQTNQLEQCSEEEINNAYDNALLYTDYFLSEVITLLKSNNKKFKTALLYVSDHGESLGENNLYLHGFPYIIAPDEQIHVPMFLWFGDAFYKDDVNLEKLKASADRKLSHDNLFHTILGLMEVKSSVYNADLDIIEHAD